MAHMPSEMERFATRSAERFPFLAPGKLRDAAGLRPGQQGYNPRTLQLPPNWFKAQKVVVSRLRLCMHARCLGPVRQRQTERHKVAISPELI